ncbi:hypothetical protein ANHS_625 [Ligilactobacillus ruminis ATCC 25644]|nr:hypothetical protein ANHS_625 [Ligilactobacillus ruminis ATCC 25644]
MPNAVFAKSVLQEFTDSFFSVIYIIADDCHAYKKTDDCN